MSKTHTTVTGNLFRHPTQIIFPDGAELATALELQQSLPGHLGRQLDGVVIVHGLIPLKWVWAEPNTGNCQTKKEHAKKEYGPKTRTVSHDVTARVVFGRQHPPLVFRPMPQGHISTLLQR
jgi:hypothetical protein